MIILLVEIFLIIGLLNNIIFFLPLLLLFNNIFFNDFFSQTMLNKIHLKFFEILIPRLHELNTNFIVVQVLSVKEQSNLDRIFVFYGNIPVIVLYKDILNIVLYGVEKCMQIGLLEAGRKVRNLERALEEIHYMYIYLFFFLFFCLFIYLFVCLFLFIYLFKILILIIIIHKILVNG